MHNDINVITYHAIKLNHFYEKVIKICSEQCNINYILNYITINCSRVVGRHAMRRKESEAVQMLMLIIAGENRWRGRLKRYGWIRLRIEDSRCTCGIRPGQLEV